jgi:hypothetical protein
MRRSANGKGPFRFVWNRSQATAHNVYLLLYPKRSLRAALRHHPELEGDVFHTLQEIKSTEIASGERVYGGGLHKVEPRELSQMPARAIFEGMAGIFRSNNRNCLSDRSVGQSSLSKSENLTRLCAENWDQATRTHYLLIEYINHPIYLKSPARLKNK